MGRGFSDSSIQRWKESWDIDCPANTASAFGQLSVLTEASTVPAVLCSPLGHDEDGYMSRSFSEEGQNRNAANGVETLRNDWYKSTILVPQPKLS